MFGLHVDAEKKILDMARARGLDQGASTHNPILLFCLGHGENSQSWIWPEHEVQIMERALTSLSYCFVGSWGKQSILDMARAGGLDHGASPPLFYYFVWVLGKTVNNINWSRPKRKTRITEWALSIPFSNLDMARDWGQDHARREIEARIMHGQRLRPGSCTARALSISKNMFIKLRVPICLLFHLIRCFPPIPIFTPWLPNTVSYPICLEKLTPVGPRFKCKKNVENHLYFLGWYSYGKLANTTEL